MNGMLQKGRNRDLVNRTHTAVKEMKREENSKEIIDILNKSGVKKAPKEYEENPYSGMYTTVLVIQIPQCHLKTGILLFFLQLFLIQFSNVQPVPYRCFAKPGLLWYGVLCLRKTYNDIDELADSIKAQGILQNLTVVLKRCFAKPGLLWYGVLCLAKIKHHLEPLCLLINGEKSLFWDVYNGIGNQSWRWNT